VASASQAPHLSWHGIKVGQPDWSDESRSLAFSLRHPQANEYLHVIFNAYWESLEFELPRLDRGECWHRVVNTALSLPEAFCELGATSLYRGNTCIVEDRSCVVLIAQAT
jgi:glycogen operon protein